MVSTFTPNINLEEPARGDDAGTWDTPVNNNMTLLDLTIGANTMVGIGSGNVTLSAGQFRSATLMFTGTLSGNVTITFPSTFMKPYFVGNLASGSSAFTITLTTTAAGQVVALPPGQYVQIFNDGTNIKFNGGLHLVGTYWDYAGSSVPNWVSACTVPPYVNCDGTTISSATYPIYAGLFGTTLPNSKGRVRFALDQGAGLISTAVFSSTAALATGGAQTVTLSSLNIPPVPITDPGHTHTARQGGNVVGSVQNQCLPTSDFFGSGSVVNSAVTGITAGSTNPTAVSIVPPAYVGGLTLIRVA